jgi:hypothetical protein
MTRGAAVVALCISLMACQIGAQPAPTPTPIPSPTPHTLAIDAVLTASDVPSGLTACGSTQTIDAYIATLTDPALAAKTSDQWTQLKAKGAREAAISVFAADPIACAAELGATTKTKAVASFVAAFADEGEADRAWESGVLGFVPPAPGELPPGVIRGTGTGLGISSWTYQRPPVQLASWHRSVFVALVVATNLDANAFKAMTVAVDARLN